MNYYSYRAPEAFEEAALDKLPLKFTSTSPPNMPFTMSVKSAETVAAAMPLLP